MTKPKISIIIPVYNAEPYLKRCFDSILANEYENLEIIPVNDGSKDKSQDIIDEYIKKYPNTFFPIIQENQGIGMARNNALEKVTGDYIMFVDNDDYIDKDYIHKHVEVLEEKNYDMVLSGYKRVNDEKKILFQVCLDGKYPWTRYISIAPWGRLYKTKYLKDNGIKFLKTAIGEDVYFNLQTNTLTNNIKVLDYMGYNWYHNGKSVTNTINNKIRKIDIINLLNTHYNILKEKNSINDENYEYIQIYFVLLSIQFMQWLSKESSYKEISDKYDMVFGWIAEHFPTYKKAKYWKLSKGDRKKIRLIFLVFMICHRLHLGKLAVYLYKFI